MKKGFKTNIETETIENKSFRRVLYTGEYSQLVLMTLQPSEETGLEVHEDTDQFFRFESGTGQVTVNETLYEVGDGDAVVVPAGAQHNVVNSSATDSLTMYTIYSPAHHRDQTVHETKAAAEADDEHFEGTTSE